MRWLAFLLHCISPLLDHFSEIVFAIFVTSFKIFFPTLQQKKRRKTMISNITSIFLKNIETIFHFIPPLHRTQNTLSLKDKVLAASFMPLVREERELSHGNKLTKRFLFLTQNQKVQIFRFRIASHTCEHSKKEEGWREEKEGFILRL